MKTLQAIVNYVEKSTKLSDTKTKNTINLIRNEIKDYIQTNGLKSLVLGVSGGLDSSVIAALCQEKYTGIPLIGISIPMSSSNAHKEQAQWIGDNYCSVFEEFTGWDNSKFNINVTKEDLNNYSTNMISEICNTSSMTDKLAEQAGFKVETFPKSVLDGNIKARMRMITLYDLARKTNGMVMSTDNLSEFQMGFWTICGDVGDFGPIQNIGKGFELPQIAEMLNIREDIIYQSPSDGLMVTDENTDEAQLGANYQEVDTIMSIYLNNLNISEGDKKWLNTTLFKLPLTDIDGSIKVAKVIGRYEGLAYKRNGTTNLTRTQIGL